MKDSFANAEGRRVVDGIIRRIKENKAYLSEIDGQIGDGDHGINMSKGASLAEQALADDQGFADSLKTLGQTILTEMGGAMGPLYGQFFRALARPAKGREEIDGELFGEMLRSGYEAIKKLGDAKVGDKTLVDTLDPAVETFNQSLEKGDSFASALAEMSRAAEKGKESTKEMVARKGRSARLGERSKGVLDAGATSCWLILDAMAQGIGELLQE